MSTDNKEFIKRFIHEFQVQRDLGAIDRHMSDDFVNHSSPPGIPNDRNGVRMFFTMMYSAFPDMEATIHQQVDDGRKVATYKTFHGTHLGDFMGIPPTGREFTIDVIDILEIENGKITSHWGAFDQMGLMRQLGVIPDPEQAAA